MALTSSWVSGATAASLPQFSSKRARKNSLRQQGVTRIDFVSMDIEGGELAALAAFDLDRFKPELFCVEAHVGNREKILAYFAAHGYARIERYIARDEVNYYFAPRAAQP